MEYSINSFAKMTGVSARTLRYYEEIGLLLPSGKKESGYRVYTSVQADLMQQILLYREMGFELSQIKQIIYSSDFDRISALENHLSSLYCKKEKISMLIDAVEKTIRAEREGYTMNDKDKFEAFKRKVIADNETKYGEEVREKYGNNVVDGTNEKMLSMTQEKWEDVKNLDEQLNNALKAAVATADPAGKEAQYACELHKQWLGNYWNFYSSQAHLGLCEMYTKDERFTAYYEKIAPGCAQFLYEAMKIYLK